MEPIYEFQAFENRRLWKQSARFAYRRYEKISWKRYGWRDLGLMTVLSLIAYLFSKSLYILPCLLSFYCLGVLIRVISAPWKYGRRTAKKEEHDFLNACGTKKPLVITAFYNDRVIRISPLARSEVLYRDICSLEESKTQYYICLSDILLALPNACIPTEQIEAFDCFCARCLSCSQVPRKHTANAAW